MTRILKWSLLVAAGVFVIVGAGLGGFLALGLGGSADEVARSVSPNGEFDAVLVETNGGATTSFGYEVFVLPHGAKPQSASAARLYGATRNAEAYGANLRWVAPSELHVEFKQTRSATLEQPVVVVAGKSVSIALRSGVVDPTAPAGGMLYNLQGRR